MKTNMKTFCLTLLAFSLLPLSASAAIGETNNHGWNGAVYTSAANFLPPTPSSSETNVTEVIIGTNPSPITNSLTASGYALFFLMGSNTITHSVSPVDISGTYTRLFPTGYSTLNNPFVINDETSSSTGLTTNNYAVTNMFKGITNAMGVYTWNAASNALLAATYGTNGTWTVPDFQLNPTRPVMIGNFSGKAFTNSFCGTIPTGDFTNNLAPGFNFVSSQIHKAGFIMEDNPDTTTGRGLNIDVQPGDYVQVWLTNGWHTSYYDEYDLTWSAIPGWTVSPDLGPKIRIGQCFMYHNSGTTTNKWIQGAHYSHN